jgi:DNA replication and repair protein RecF
MQCEHLQLTHFRNLSPLDWRPHPRVNLLLGDNAQGKTNVLEALFLLATTRSLRASQDAEMVGHGKPEALLRALVLRQATGAVRGLEMQLRREGKRTLRLNEKAVRRASEFFGQLSVVLFTPSDLGWVQAGPAVRRAWLDLLLCQASPLYLQNLQAYQHALRQRNAALKLLCEGRSGRDMVEAFDTPLVESGAEVLRLRAEACAALEPMAARRHAAIAKGEALALHRVLTVPEPGEGTSQAWQQSFAARLEATRREESSRGLTVVGPHRDDLRAHVEGREARAFASQGQQRTVALALKLAEVELLRARLGEDPVLLLDDVLSELDGQRQRALLGLLDTRVQTFLTGTHAEALPFEPGQVLKVRAGALERQRA